MTAICEEPQGRSLYYFPNTSTVRDKKNQFIETETTGMPDSEISLIWNLEEKNATFNIQGTSTQFKSILINSDQISFIGVINYSAILFNLYLKEQIGVYSQHSSWKPFDDGIRASFFLHEMQD